MSPSSVEYLAKADLLLAKIIETVPSPEIKSTNNVFHDLMSCILEQQIHYRSTKNIFKRMLERADLEELTVEHFPVFEEKAFEGIKLSMRKYETVLRIVEFWQTNQLNWKELTDEEVCAQLGQIKGVGKWTIDMILLFTLQRPNVFPYDDFHLKNIMTTLYELNPKSKLKAQMLAVAENWQPQQSLAVHYLLAWKTFNKKQKK